MRLFVKFSFLMFLMFAGQASAALVYDNGTSTTHTGGNCSDCVGSGWRVFDDFTLGSTTTIGAIEWDAAYYSNTDKSNPITISFWSGLNTGLINSSSFTWSDVESTVNNSSNSTFFADLTDFTLGAGTTYLSIYSYNHFMPTSGGNGHWQLNTPTDTMYYRAGYYVPFRLYGANDAQVPEPATLALFGLGLAGMGFARKKRKSA